jgi:hypothetical protein
METEHPPFAVYAYRYFDENVPLPMGANTLEDARAMAEFVTGPDSPTEYRLAIVLYHTGNGEYGLTRYVSKRVQ